MTATMAGTGPTPRVSAAGGNAPGALPAEVEKAVRVQNVIGVSLHLTGPLVQHPHALLEAKNAAAAADAPALSAEKQSLREPKTPDAMQRFRGNNDVIATLTKVAESLNQAQAELEYRKQYHGLLAHQQLGAVYEEIVHGQIPEEVCDQVVRDMEAMNRILADAPESSRPPSRIAPVAVPAVLASLKEKERWGYFKSAPWLMPDYAGGMILRKRTARNAEPEAGAGAPRLAAVVAQAMSSNAPMVIQVRERSSRVKQARESWERVLKVYKQKKRENYMAHLSNILALNSDKVKEKFAARIIQRAWRKHRANNLQLAQPAKRSASRRPSHRRQHSVRGRPSRASSVRRQASQARSEHMTTQEDGPTAQEGSGEEEPKTHFPHLVALLKDAAASTAASLARTPTKTPKKNLDFSLWDACTTVSSSMRERPAGGSFRERSFKDRSSRGGSFRERSASRSRSLSRLDPSHHSQAQQPQAGPASQPLFVVSRVVRSAGGVGISSSSGDFPLAPEQRVRPSRSADGHRPPPASGTSDDGTSGHGSVGLTSSALPDYEVFRAQAAGGIAWPRTEREAAMRVQAVDGAILTATERHAQLWGPPGQHWTPVGGQTAASGSDWGHGADRASTAGGRATTAASAMTEGPQLPSIAPMWPQAGAKSVRRRLHAVSDSGAFMPDLDRGHDAPLVHEPRPPAWPPTGRQVTFRARVSTSGSGSTAQGSTFQGSTVWPPPMDKEDGTGYTGGVGPGQAFNLPGLEQDPARVGMRARTSASVGAWPALTRQASRWDVAGGAPSWHPDPSNLFLDEAGPNAALDAFMSVLHAAHGDVMSGSGRLRRLLRQELMTGDPRDAFLVELRERYKQLQLEQQQQYLLLRKLDLSPDAQDDEQKQLRQMYAEMQSALQQLAEQIQGELQARQQQRDMEQMAHNFPFCTFPRGAGGQEARVGSLTTLDRLRSMRPPRQPVGVEELRAALLNNGLPTMGFKSATQGMLKRGPAHKHLGHLLKDDRGSYDPTTGWGNAPPLRIAGMGGRLPRCSVPGTDADMSQAASAADAAAVIEAALARRRQAEAEGLSATGQPRGHSSAAPKHPRTWLRSMSMGLQSVPSIRRPSDIDLDGGLLPSITGIKSSPNGVIQEGDEPSALDEGEDEGEDSPGSEEGAWPPRAPPRPRLPSLARQPSRKFLGSLSKAYRETQKMRWSSQEGTAAAVRAAAEAELGLQTRRSRSPDAPRPRGRSPPALQKVPTAHARMAQSWSGSKQQTGFDEG